MAFLIGLVGVLLGGALLLRWLVDADPKALAFTLKATGAILGGLGVLLLVATRNIGAAMVVLSLLLPPLMAWRTQARRAKAARGPSAGGASAIRTAFLDVRLSHETGLVTGEVLAGRFAGRRFEELDLGELLALHGETGAADPQSQTIVEAHLDRSFGADWREAADAGGASGSGGASGEGAADRPMDEAEALAVLGLSRGASPQEIKAAYHRLRKRYHPDQGGSAALAARLNAARDRLLQGR
jgi:hypothetical protein